MYVLGVFNEKLYLGFNLFVGLDIRANSTTGIFAEPVLSLQKDSVHVGSHYDYLDLIIPIFFKKVFGEFSHQNKSLSWGKAFFK